MWIVSGCRSLRKVGLKFAVRLANLPTRVLDLFLLIKHACPLINPWKGQGSKLLVLEKGGYTTRQRVMAPTPRRYVELPILTVEKLTYI
jgi:hypothetical protein